MIAFLLATITAFQDPYVAPEHIQRRCAAVVGIPYASDNFSEEEWYKYLECIQRNLTTEV